jgi:hypothetical protein
MWGVLSLIHSMSNTWSRERAMIGVVGHAGGTVSSRSCAVIAMREKDVGVASFSLS